MNSHMTEVAEGIHRLTNGVSNFYLIEDAGKLVLVDAGAPRDWDLLGRVVRELGRDLGDLDAVLLTHAHTDHIADLARLEKGTGAPVYISERESIPGAETISEGQEFNVGNLKVKALLTWGHSRGGITFFVTGLARPVAIVGDSIFAGSMGGGNVSYKDALRNNIEKILTLPDETIICPGHGPMTTVGEEKRSNPFFAGRV